MSKKFFILFTSAGLGGAGYGFTALRPTLVVNKEEKSNLEEVKEEAKETQKEEVEVLPKPEEKQQEVVAFAPEIIPEKRVSNGGQRIGASRYRKREVLTRSQGKKKVDLIREYSLKLSGAINCTGGFLDYEIPKGPYTYPRKWFIATNIHCLLNSFFNSNEYEIELPTRRRTFNNSVLTLSKERLNVPRYLRGLEFDSSKGEGFNRRYGSQFERTQVKRYAQTPYVPRNVDRWLFKEYNPKLVYAAINFLGDYKTARSLGYPFYVQNYYKDFAVIEINFNTEKQARRLTGDFYNKFDPVVGYRSGEAIDFFADELMARKTPDALVNEQEDFFVAGYPVNAWSDSYSVSNFDEKSGKASRLSLDNHPYAISNSYRQYIPGHVDNGRGEAAYEHMSSDYVQRWNGKPLKTGGYRYLLENIRVKAGSSGSITTDSSRKLLGLNTATGDHYGEIEPIRSKGVYDQYGRMLYPEYDLIEGTSRQVHSYKSQIQKYFLIKGIQTNLSRMRGGGKELGVE